VKDEALSMDSKMVKEEEEKDEVLGGSEEKLRRRKKMTEDFCITGEGVETVERGHRGTRQVEKNPEQEDDTQRSRRGGQDGEIDPEPALIKKCGSGNRGEEPNR
jgi:hypothetical protein